LQQKKQFRQGAVKLPQSGIGEYWFLLSLCLPAWFQPLPFPEVVLEIHVGNPATSRWQGF
jgi:hypothetical protein